MTGARTTCKRCILSSDVPEVTFNHEGLCNQCLEYDELVRRYPTDERGEKELASIVARIKEEGRGRDYDCVLGVSGGVDSTYMLYMAKKLGLNPLAVHFDNGWNSELAVSNIKKVVSKLDVDLYTYVVDWEEFRDLQLAFLRASVSDAEIPTDIAIKSVLYRTAIQEGVKYVVYGGSNFRSEGRIPKAWTYMDGRYVRSVQSRYGTKKLRSFPNLTLTDLLYYLYVRRLKIVRLLYHMDFRNQDVIKLLEDKLGWVYYGGKHYESVYTRFFQSYILPRKFNIDKRIIHYSALIRSAQLTREEALDKLAGPACPEAQAEEDREYVLKKFGLTASEFDELMARPAKSFHDFPTYYPLIRRIQFVKKLGIWPQVG